MYHLINIQVNYKLKTWGDIVGLYWHFSEFNCQGLGAYLDISNFIILYDTVKCIFTSIGLFCDGILP